MLGPVLHIPAIYIKYGKRETLVTVVVKSSSFRGTKLCSLSKING